MHPFQLDLHLPPLMQQQVRPLCVVHAVSEWCHCSCSQAPKIISSPRVMQLLVASLNGALWNGSSCLESGFGRSSLSAPASGAGAQSAASSSSGTPGWLIAAIVVPIAVLVVAVAALAILMIRKRQLDKRKQAQDPDHLKVRGASMCGAWEA